MSEWKDARFFAPIETGRYLVCLDRTAPEQLGGNSRRIVILRWTDSGWRMPVHFPKWINSELTETVTYWRPLPEPPSGGER